MDIEVPSRPISKELARELLISISYSVPEAAKRSELLSGSSNCSNGAVLSNGDWAEKYRSELISISYVQSPDMIKS